VGFGPFPVLLENPSEMPFTESVMTIQTLATL
jgi:hypothetical protein